MDNRLLSMVLAGIAAVAALLSLWLMLRDPRSLNVPADLDAAVKLPDVTAVLSAQLPNAPLFDRYDEVLERPLFSDDRRPPDPSAQDTTASGGTDVTADVALDVTLSGVIITPQDRYATITRKAGRKKKANRVVQTVRVGERLAPPLQVWRVAGIEPRQLKLQRVTGGATTAVKLDVYTGSLGHSAGRSKPPRRAKSGAAAARSAAAKKSDAETRKNEIKRRIAAERERRRQEQEKRKNR